MQTGSISDYIWRQKYRCYGENTLDDTWQRVARAIAAPEAEAVIWTERFLTLLKAGSFLPGGRIIAGAGTANNVTLFNCFVMGLIPDDMNGIFDSLREAALTMQAGGGVGHDFSTLRPKGSKANRTGNIASGPVSFMQVWNAMCATLLSSGARRGAMLASLRCDHPDIELFIDAKRDNNLLEHFNLSVQVTDSFMQAVMEKRAWPLIYPLRAEESIEGREIVQHEWTGTGGKVPCVVHRHVDAATLWHRIMSANYYSGEPGVLFIDRINALNNLHWREELTCTNPCGEIPLPPYGACNLGSLNLACFIQHPFSEKAGIALDRLADAAKVAVRFLDNVIDTSLFPLPSQREMALSTRRIGLGITGLADALMMLGLNYGSSSGREKAAQLMQTICYAAYQCSIQLAQEKGCFPAFEQTQFLKSRFIQSLPEELIAAIEKYGIRNSHLLAIAPAGTISLLADNTSSGIEPVFSFRQQRRIMTVDGGQETLELENKAWRLWREDAGANAIEPKYFITALELPATAHLQMQAALQPFVDSAISKTINVPADCAFEEFSGLYVTANNLGLKGCTTFRTGCRNKNVLVPAPDCTRCEMD